MGGASKYIYSLLRTSSPLIQVNLITYLCISLS
nr:MAG TPA: hypothetical protein [Caudoviricetes sp.]